MKYFNSIFPAIANFDGGFFKDQVRFAAQGADHPPRCFAYLWSLVRHQPAGRNGRLYSDQRILTTRFSELYPIIRNGLASILEIQGYIAGEILRPLRRTLTQRVGDLACNANLVPLKTGSNSKPMGETCFRDYLGCRPKRAIHTWVQEEHKKVLQLHETGPTEHDFEAAVEPLQNKLRTFLYSSLGDRPHKVQEVHQETLWIAWLTCTSLDTLNFGALVGIALRALRRVYRDPEGSGIHVHASEGESPVETFYFQYFDPAESVPSDCLDQLDAELSREVMRRVLQWPEKVFQAMCFLGIRMMRMTPQQLIETWSHLSLGAILSSIGEHYCGTSILPPSERLVMLHPLLDVFLGIHPGVCFRLRRLYRLNPRQSLILIKFKSVVGPGSLDRQSARISHWINEFQGEMERDFRRKACPGLVEWFSEESRRPGGGGPTGRT